MELITAPEILTAILALVLLIVHFVAKEGQSDLAPAVTLMGVFSILVISFAFPYETHPDLLKSLFSSYMGKYGEYITYRYKADPLSMFGARLLLVCLMLAVLASWDYLKGRTKSYFEYYALLTFSTAGLIFMVNSQELITFLVSLEISALSLYALAAYFNHNKFSIEAGMKYMIIGATFSGLLLYGIVLIYGATGTTSFEQLSMLTEVVTDGPQYNLLICGTILICFVFAFKLGVAPFHFWAPDVYQGSPTPITGYLSVAPKAAGFMVLMRLLDCLIPLQGATGSIFLKFFLATAIISMVIGNIMAIGQTNLKRLMAYSSIGQVGYLLMGIVAANSFGLAAILFFLVSYVFSNMAVFTVVACVSNHDEKDMDDFYGLGKRSPFLAMILLMGILSLSGIPPMSGFFAKLYVFSAAIKAKYYMLVFLAMIATTVSLYYYLNVLRAMYIEEPHERQAELVIGAPAKCGLWACLLGMLYFGIFPAGLVSVCYSIASSFQLAV